MVYCYSHWTDGNCQPLEGRVFANFSNTDVRISQGQYWKVLHKQKGSIYNKGIIPKWLAVFSISVLNLYLGTFQWIYGWGGTSILLKYRVLFTVPWSCSWKLSHEVTYEYSGHSLRYWKESACPPPSLHFLFLNRVPKQHSKITFSKMKAAVVCWKLAFRTKCGKGEHTFRLLSPWLCISFN